jgi:hypothetical protein
MQGLSCHSPSPIVPITASSDDDDDDDDEEMDTS